MINRYIPEAVMNTAITSAAAQASALTESTSFESLSASWIEYLQVSATSVKDYTRAVRQFVRYLAEHSVSRPQRSDVIAYRESLRASKKPATVQLYMTAVRLFFRWLETEHLYEDVAKDIKGAKIDRSHKKDYLTAEQVKALLRAVTSPRDKAMLAAMVCCGLRCIEVVRLNVEDLTVSAGHTVLMVQGKGHEERTPVKVPQAVERLRGSTSQSGKTSQRRLRSSQRQATGTSQAASLQGASHASLRSSSGLRALTLHA